AGSPLEEFFVKAASRVRRPYDRFFATMHDASGGLIRDALRIWLAAVERVDEPDDIVRMARARPQVQRPLRHLSDEALIKFYKVLRQGWMDAKVFASLYRIEAHQAEAELGHLAHLGLLERNGGAYRLAPHVRG